MASMVDTWWIVAFCAVKAKGAMFNSVYIIFYRCLITAFSLVTFLITALVITTPLHNFFVAQVMYSYTCP